MTDTLLPGGKTILCFVLSQLLGLSTLVSVFLVMQRSTGKKTTQRLKLQQAGLTTPSPPSKDDIFRQSGYPIPEKLKFSFLICLRAKDAYKVIPW